MTTAIVKIDTFVYSSLQQSRSCSNEIRRAEIFCRNRDGVLMRTFCRARSHLHYLDARCKQQRTRSAKRRIASRSFASAS